MIPRVSVITLGVSDLPRARRFYADGLGWPIAPLSNEHIVFFQAGGLIVALFGRQALAADADLPAPAPGGEFGGITLAHNVASRQEVVRVLAEARRAGATILKLAQPAEWGGHHGYFADPDGHVWEVAWNPAFALTADGAALLPPLKS